MSEPPRKLYWDSSCFICLLNDAEYERNRRIVVEDILENAERGVVEIWTSTYTIVEVIRPKRHGSAPMPAWAIRAMKFSGTGISAGKAGNGNALEALSS